MGTYAALISAGFPTTFSTASTEKRSGFLWCAIITATPTMELTANDLPRVEALFSMPSRPLPLIDPRELARRNNESSAASQKPRRTKSRRLSKLLDKLPPPNRPIQAVGFFYPDRQVGFHDSRP